MYPQSKEKQKNQPNKKTRKDVFHHFLYEIIPSANVFIVPKHHWIHYTPVDPASSDYVDFLHKHIMSM